MPADLMIIHYKENDEPNDRFIEMYTKELGVRKPGRAQQIEELRTKRLTFIIQA